MGRSRREQYSTGGMDEEREESREKRKKAGVLCAWERGRLEKKKVVGPAVVPKKKLLSQARIENFSGATEGGEGGKWGECGVDCEPRYSSHIHA